MIDTLQAPKVLLQAQKLANLTDSKIRIPFLGIRLGLARIIRRSKLKANKLCKIGKTRRTARSICLFSDTVSF